MFTDYYRFSFMSTEPIIFFLSCFFVYSLSYRILHSLLKRLNEKYNDYDINNQYYILSNILKSLTLFILVIVLLNNLEFMFNHDKWYLDKLFLTNVTAIYSITDFSALLFSYNRMNRSTITHHIGVILAYTYIYYCNFEKEGIHKSIIYYGMFSSIPFLVNFYLGIRFLYKRENTIIIKKLCFWVYLLSVIFNWFWQIRYTIQLIQLNHYYTTMFILGMMLNWLYDDTKLLYFLK